MLSKTVYCPGYPDGFVHPYVNPFIFKPTVVRSFISPYFSMNSLSFQIRVRNTKYESEPSETVVLVTPEGRPSAIGNLRATPLGVDQFKITWNPPKEPNGELHGYRLYYREGINL